MKIVNHYPTGAETMPVKIFSDESEVDDFIYENLPSKGLCVEIGANSIKNSHCINLYKKGWEGIVVEGDPNTYKNLISDYGKYPQLNVKLFNYVLCEENGTKTFYSDITHTNSGLSSLYYKHATGLADPANTMKRQVTSFTVESRTLESLLDENNKEKIDYLQIDTEGADAEIILSTDFSKCKPKLIFAETNKLHCYLASDQKETDAKECYKVWEMVNKHLSKFNYELTAMVVNENYTQMFCPDTAGVPLNAVWKLRKELGIR